MFPCAKSACIVWHYAARTRLGNADKMDSPKTRAILLLAGTLRARSEPRAMCGNFSSPLTEVPNSLLCVQRPCTLFRWAQFDTLNRTLVPTLQHASRPVWIYTSLRLFLLPQGTSLARDPPASLMRTSWHSLFAWRPASSRSTWAFRIVRAYTSV